MLKKLVTVTRSGSIESEHYGVGAIVNSEGKILKEGIPEDLAKDEIVRKVYLGKNFEFKRKKI